MASGVSESNEAQRQRPGVQGQCPSRDSEPDKVIFNVYINHMYWTSVMKNSAAPQKKEKKRKRKKLNDRSWWQTMKSLNKRVRNLAVSKEPWDISEVIRDKHGINKNIPGLGPQKKYSSPRDLSSWEGLFISNDP